jgi:hypothetical protein
LPLIRIALQAVLQLWGLAASNKWKTIVGIFAVLSWVSTSGFTALKNVGELLKPSLPDSPEKVPKDLSKWPYRGGEAAEPVTRALLALGPDLTVATQRRAARTTVPEASTPSSLPEDRSGRVAPKLFAQATSEVTAPAGQPTATAAKAAPGTAAPAGARLVAPAAGGASSAVSNQFAGCSGLAQDGKFYGITSPADKAVIPAVVTITATAPQDATAKVWLGTYSTYFQSWHMLPLAFESGIAYHGDFGVGATDDWKANFEMAYFIMSPGQSALITRVRDAKTGFLPPAWTVTSSPTEPLLIPGLVCQLKVRRGALGEEVTYLSPLLNNPFAAAPAKADLAKK